MMDNVAEYPKNNKIMISDINRRASLATPHTNIQLISLLTRIMQDYNGTEALTLTLLNRLLNFYIIKLS